MVSMTVCTPGGDDLVIGVVGPIKGPYADIGRQTRDGATLAAEELNRRGGVDGKRVRIEFRDDSDRSRLGSILGALVSSGAIALVGPEDLAAVSAKESAPSRAGIPVLAMASAGKVGADRNLFRMTPSNASMAETIAQWMTQVRSLSKVAVVGSSDEWGRDGVRSVTAALGRRGVTPIASHQMSPGTVDVSPLAQALKASGAEVLVAWLPPDDAARLLAATNQVGWRVQMAGPDSFFRPDFRSIAGSQTDNVVLSMARFAEEAWLGPAAREWFVDYHARFGLAPIPSQRTLVTELPLTAVAAYDAVRAIAESSMRVDGDQGSKLVAALRTSRHQGVLREIRFNADGETYASDDIQMARFLNLAVVYDVTPGADLERQAAFYKVQVSGFQIPDAYLDTREGKAVYDRILEDVLTDPEKVEFFKAYVPPRDPPGPL